MIFLVEYDRPSGCLISCRTFSDSRRVDAEDARIEREVALNRAGVEREIVLLEAASEDALRRTHRRYFEDLNELATELAE
ncbi:MAG: hypothetical protein A3H96_03720 [Acidobacteria bacterium RIFCSPLOWO2_02_FULL_67_36]|nr:MAG: hypothetical protein A3H96_03720 [Acidobacteria bacterium RIFCSPLOWO2_02_FULL_67_36]OFW24645.1 MAG: hypothetical protein A3G21_16995 [Acidobacteria bacterium RIFCSPLOWO2_12_FULL_66_21]